MDSLSWIFSVCSEAVIICEGYFVCGYVMSRQEECTNLNYKH